MKKIQSMIAYKIWQIRDDLEIEGSQEHDWWLAGKFFQSYKDKFDEDDIYVWYMQLDENLAIKQTEE